jgi:putative phage-type endonuclease
MVLTDFVPGSDEWLEERRKYICGTDAPKILGKSRYGAPHDVCLDKWGEAPSVEVTPAMTRGHDLQDPIALAYQKLIGDKLLPEVFVTHPKKDWMAATPDARVDGKSKHIQIKTHVDWLLDEYGPSGSDRFPEAERIQVLHEMTVLGNSSADLVVLFAEEQAFNMLVEMRKTKMLDPVAIANYILNAMDMRIYPVESDHELQGIIVDTEREFLEKYVKPHVLPPTSPIRKDSGKIRSATQEDMDRVEELKHWWILLKKAETYFEERKFEMIKVIGEDKGVDIGNGAKITYAKAKDTVGDVVDWDAVAESLEIQRDDLDAIIAECTKKETIRVGTRRFTVPHARWKKEL